jgi:uncharacterized membrane protein
MLDSSISLIRKAAAMVKRFFLASPRHLVTYLANGLIIMVPIVVTIWVLVWFFNLIDGLLAPIIRWGFGHPVPGLGFGIIAVTTFFVGYFGIRVGHLRFFAYIESSIVKIPVIGSIYDGVRQIVQSVSSRNAHKFLKVVFMEFPRKGIYTVGFVTGETSVKGERMLNVFIPTAPTPFSGFLQIVPPADVVPSSITVNQAMKLIISAGGFSPGEISEMKSDAARLPGEEKPTEPLAQGSHGDGA